MGYIDICSASRLPFKGNRAVLFQEDSGSGLVAEMSSLRDVCYHKAQRGAHNEDGMFLPDGLDDEDENWINTSARVIVREDVYDAYLEESRLGLEDIQGIHTFIRTAFPALVDDEYASAKTMKKIYDASGYKPEMSPKEALHFSDKAFLKWQIIGRLNDFYYDTQTSEPSRDAWFMLCLFKGDAAGRAERLIEMCCLLSEEDFITESVPLLEEMAFIYICDKSGTVLTPNIGVSDCDTDITLKLRAIEQKIMKNDMAGEEQIFEAPSL